MSQQTLVSLKEAFQKPFAPEMIQFKPKDIHQEKGKLVCRALPYANKRIYEDRLNALVLGEWSTPYIEPFAQGNKLIIPATVIVLGVAHTDYGEAFLLATSKNGNTREDENTATEAYSQAFRRACSKFFLGRYLYDLPKLTLPYNSELKQIDISKAERIAWVEKLYQMRGLLPKVYIAAAKPALVSPPTQKTHEETAAAPMTPEPLQAVKTLPVQESDQAQTSAPLAAAEVQRKASMPPVATAKSSPVSKKTSATTTTSAPQQKASSAVKEPAPMAAQPTAYPNDTFLDWVAKQVERDPERIQGICDYYQVTGLAQLNENQRNALTKRLRKQASQQRQAAPGSV